MKIKKDKWGKKQVFAIDVVPYRQDCIVVLNGQFSDAIKIFQKNKKAKGSQLNLKHIEENKEDYAEMYIPNSGAGALYTELPKGYVMMVSHENSWIETVGTISHECLHLAQYVLRRAGITETKESEEAYTYLHSNILKQVLEKLY